MNAGPHAKKLLAVLGVLMLFLLWNQFGPSDGGGGVEDAGANLNPGGRVGARRPSANEAVVETVVELRIGDLQKQPRDYRPGRNPWSFPAPPPPPPPPPPPKPKPPSEEELRARREAEERLRAQQAAAAAEAAKPRPPQFTLKYIGRIGPQNSPIAVFTNGTDILNVQEGEVIEGKFIVAQIGYESVAIEFVDFPDWPALRLPVGRR